MSATVFFESSDEYATLQNIFEVSGTPTDPTTVTLTVTDPTGTQTTPSTTHVSTGTYTALVTCTVVGTWGYLWEGTGTASDAVAGTWTVTDPALSRLYCTPAELKSRLGITGTGDDFEIMLAVQAASRGIEEICGRFFWRDVNTVRTYIPESIYRQSIDDCVSVSALAVDRDGTGSYTESWTQDVDYALEVTPGRYNPGSLGEQWPFTGFNIIGPKYIPIIWPWRPLNAIKITGTWGWPAVPLAVKMAALIAAADLFKLKDAPFGVAGVSDMGIMRVQANSQVYALLERYVSAQRVGV